jgi:lysophospholipase L1-like esterase
MTLKSKRILLVLLTGVGLIVLAAGGLFFRFARPTGSGPAGPAVDRTAFSSPWTNRRVLLVGLGDSVTAGFGARRGYSYFDRLAANPADEFPDLHGTCLAAVLPNLQYTNLAVSATTSSELLRRELNRLPIKDPEVFGLIVLTTGGNDIIHDYGRLPPREEAMYGATVEQAKPWAEHFAQRLTTILTQIESRFPGGCEIFLANIFDPTDGVGDAERTGLPPWKDCGPVLALFNTVIRHAAEADPHVRLVDVHQAFLGHGIHCLEFWREHFDRHDPHYWLFDNLEDPNERGYDAVRRLFLREMARAKEGIK